MLHGFQSRIGNLYEDDSMIGIYSCQMNARPRIQIQTKRDKVRGSSQEACDMLKRRECSDAAIMSPSLGTQPVIWLWISCHFLKHHSPSQSIQQIKRPCMPGSDGFVICWSCSLPGNDNTFHPQQELREHCPWSRDHI